MVGECVILPPPLFVTNFEADLDSLRNSRIVTRAPEVHPASLVTQGDMSPSKLDVALSEQRFSTLPHLLKTITKTIDI
jgi:hypothetical protein